MNVKLILAVALCLIGCVAAHSHHHQRRSHDDGPITAKCTFTTPSTKTVEGTLTLTQASCTAPVVISGKISGLKPAGDHGFHVHETADFSDGCTSALAHYNPLKKAHGAPVDDERHNGDLGNVQADASGISNVQIEDKLVSLSGQYSSIGRSIVVHEMPDDLGKGNFPDSKTTGHAGARVACCVIGYGKPV